MRFFANQRKKNMQKCIKKIKIIKSGGLSISLDYLAIGKGNPKTLILSGIHGSERTGNLIIAKLMENLPEFKGTLMILPLVNPLGYTMGSREEPLSGLDINRQFTGKKDNRPVFAITAAIMKLCEKCDYIIDLHNYTTAGLIQIGFSNSSKAMELASLLNPDVIRASHTEKAWRLEGTLMNWLQNKGIPYVLVELPTHRNVTDEQCEKVVNGIKKHLINNDKNNELIDKRPSVKIKLVKSPQNGVFNTESKISLGDIVKKNDLLGKLTSLPSGKKMEIFCPYNGIICEKETQNKFPTIAGNTLFGIGEISEMTEGTVLK